jgi:CRISPR-associated endonuclease/helicase Cas3
VSAEHAVPIAHARRGEDDGWVEHGLAAHLRAVADLAAGFAARFGAADWAGVAGLWHDLGKYRPAFQRYIRCATGYEADAHIETAPGRVDHSTAGARHAIERFGADPRGRILAYLIAGHHAGLPDWHPDETGRAALQVRLGPESAPMLAEVHAQAPPQDLLDAPLPSSAPLGARAGFALWVRMLFSCLVDADFLDTEAFMSPGRSAGRQGFATIEALRGRLDAHMHALESLAEPSPVNRIRGDVLRQCRAAAALRPGIFSLTVPTGGGKTLASLAFALDHSAAHGKRRVIYAIPYTSIIEQTADVFREVFGEDQVVEHHSAADVAPEREDHRTRLACENWDAPIVVTTNVQFFESLFAARTSRVRKLHAIAGSVVVLDETQLLPPEYLQPILDAISLLASHYGVTFVLSTATQPALASTRWFGGGIRGLEGVKEIVANPGALYSALRRVDVTLPDDFHRPQSWPEIAAALRDHVSVLCVVNSRKDCRELHRLMPAGTIHLSALMCGQHRSEVIARIRRMLRAGEPVRAVSTQLVEAGVDLDFPVVYRALAGLDSIAQAAGRCNREGRLPRGQVVVFAPPGSPPPGILRNAAQAAVSLLSEARADPLSHELYPRYFASLYSRVDLDKHGIVGLLTQGAGQAEIAFRTAAERFRLIDDSLHQTVLVQYGEAADGLLRILRAQGPQRWLMRKLQRYTVNLPRRQFEALLRAGDVTEIYRGFYAQASAGLYDPVIGFVTASDEMAADSLVI